MTGGMRTYGEDEGDSDDYDYEKDYDAHCLIALAQAVLIADIFLIGGLQQVAKGQEGVFILHV